LQSVRHIVNVSRQFNAVSDVKRVDEPFQLRSRRSFSQHCQSDIDTTVSQLRDSPDRMFDALEVDEVGDHHSLFHCTSHRRFGGDGPCWQLPRQQSDVVSRETYGSNGLGLLLSLDSDDVEAVEIAHRVEPVRKNLAMRAVPRMTEVTAVEK